MSYLLASRSVEVVAPVESVFFYAANLENYSAWFPGVLSIRAKDSRALDEIGKAYEEIVSVPFGKSVKVLIRVVEASYPERLVTEGDLRVLLPRMELSFQALDDNKTLMEWRMYSRRRGKLAGLLRPLFRLVLQSRSRYALIRLKTMLEGHERQGG